MYQRMPALERGREVTFEDFVTVNIREIPRFPGKPLPQNRFQPTPWIGPLLK
jgi:hypothetical protein